MHTLAASPPVVTILSGLVEEHTGLHYGPEDRQVFVDKVSERAQEAGFESLLDYYYYLRYDAGAAAELERLVDALVVGETYFFRELQPLQVLVRRFIQPWVAKGRRPRVWSAACATGEEPLTLAMLLAEADLLSRVELIASDISSRALGRAKEGRFGTRSLREHALPQVAERWLTRHEGRTVVAPELIDQVSWRQVNLLSKAEVAKMGQCDVILCRNVLIYFSDETAAGVVARLAERLSPDGALLVGVSESLLRLGTALSCEELDGVFFYRKAG
jgi:chemotaxis protein methyltransferase CheR